MIQQSNPIVVSLDMEEDRTVEIIERWQQSVDRKMFDFEGNPSINVESDRRYQKLQNLMLVQVAADYSANFYFDPSGKCVMVYVTDLEILIEMKLESIFLRYGEPEKVVESRSGDRYRHFIYATQGFAFSANAREIRFFESFPKMTVGEYLLEIY